VESMKNYRMTGLIKSPEALKNELHRLDVTEKASRLTRNSRPTADERQTPEMNYGPFENLLMDLIWFHEIGSTGANKTIKTRDGYMGVVLVYDPITRTGFIEPIRSESQDFKNAVIRFSHDS